MGVFQIIFKNQKMLVIILVLVWEHVDEKTSVPKTSSVLVTCSRLWIGTY